MNDSHWPSQERGRDQYGDHSAGREEAIIVRRGRSHDLCGPMTNRPSVLRNVGRKLWAEAFGYCMNPECESALISDGGVNLGEMAHIVTNADRGEPSFDNMILLCKDCHAEIDATRTSKTIPRLRAWKRDRETEMRQRFSRAYASFDELRADVVPLLERNGRIFSRYGPTGDVESAEQRRALWNKFEGELIANNMKLQLMFENSEGLFHKENWDIVTSFGDHVEEFINTRDDSDYLRIILFPQSLLSIFGIDKDISGRPVPNLSALGSLIGRLLDEDAFVDLELEPTQTLTYMDDGKLTMFDLHDRPHVHQIFWNGQHYRRNSTNVRIDDLVFVLKWLRKNDISYRFEDLTRLSELTLQDDYHVKLFYSYVLSLSDAYQVDIKENQIAVNIHSWNGGPISEDAKRYAKDAGFRIMNQRAFFAYAHRNIK